MARYEVDVLVVGSGAAGLAAALVAQEQGARVVVVESEKVVGGASRLSGGYVLGVDTELQRAAGLHDDQEGFFHEYMFATQFQLKSGLLRRMAQESGPAVDWLVKLGVDFYPDVMQGGGERVPRSHVPNGGDVPGGQHVINVLHQRAKERGVEIALGNRVEHLLQNRDGAVVGVVARGEELEAGAVVLASGGIGGNQELIDKHLPSIARYGAPTPYLGTASSRGDALALGGEVGANTVGHDIYVAVNSPRLGPGETGNGYLPGWLLLLGTDGRRLFEETAPYGQTYGLMRAAGGVVYGLFDARTLADHLAGRLQTFKPKFPEGSAGPTNIWTTDAVERYLESGAIVASQTLGELAEKLGLPEPAVIGAVERYNGFAQAGHDRDFDKPERFLRPIQEPPFYGVDIRPSTVGVTGYGVEIDDESHVLDPNSKEIEGLFAAGECVGGVLGNRYMGSGNSWASCLVFGRTAGRMAATHALKTPV